MADKKERREPESATGGNVAALSGTIVKESMGLVKAMIEAGESSLMQAYASTVIVGDFLHSGGLLSDDAWKAILLMVSGITGVATIEGIVATLFGDNVMTAMTPQLHTKVVQTVTDKEAGTSTTSTQEASGKAAQALAALIPAAVGAAI